MLMQAIPIGPEPCPTAMALRPPAPIAPHDEFALRLLACREIAQRSYQAYLQLKEPYHGQL